MVKRYDVSKAMRNREVFYRPLERTISYILSEIIYKPILDIVKEEIGKDWIEQEAPKVKEARQTQERDDLREEIKRNKEIIPQALQTLHNAKTSLKQAILSGRVQYVKDHFEGMFSGAISAQIKKLGGRWDKRSNKWYILLDKLPYDMQLAVGQARDRGIRVRQRIDAHLAELERIAKKQPQYDLTPIFEKTIKGLEQDFNKSISGMTVAPQLTPEMAAKLAEQYTDNMNYYINGWTEQSIVRLREKVQENAFKGYRSSELAKMLLSDYQISKNKAAFLARQETSLLMSKFREERYKSAGVTKYKWSTSGDVRVRPMHKRLNGTIHTWDNPPIVDEQGKRAHPGEDFGCRCVAIPILD